MSVRGEPRLPVYQPPKEDEVADSVIEVAADAILRRARVLDAQDPEIAHGLRSLVLNLRPDMVETSQ